MSELFTRTEYLYIYQCLLNLPLIAYSVFSFDSIIFVVIDFSKN